MHADQRGGEPEELLLVEVRDRPGTEADQAVFRVRSGAEEGLLTLGRRADGEWVYQTLD
jgi:hypothetical protein